MAVNGDAFRQYLVFASSAYHHSVSNSFNSQASEPKLHSNWAASANAFEANANASFHNAGCSTGVRKRSEQFVISVLKRQVIAIALCEYFQCLQQIFGNQEVLLTASALKDRRQVIFQAGFLSFHVALNFCNGHDIGMALNDKCQLNNEVVCIQHAQSARINAMPPITSNAYWYFAGGLTFSICLIANAPIAIAADRPTISGDMQTGQIATGKWDFQRNGGPASPLRALRATAATHFPYLEFVYGVTPEFSELSVLTFQQ